MEFGEFWDTVYSHPCHKGNKQTAERLYESLSEIAREKMLMATEGYKIGLAEESWRSPMQMTRWLRNPGEWEGPLEQAQERADSEVRAAAWKQEQEKEHAEQRRKWREEDAQKERDRPLILEKFRKLRAEGKLPPLRVRR